ncbi:response regulator transcription factor [bacterium]|nr:response regulator transcription factor [bacterium]
MHTGSIFSDSSKRDRPRAVIYVRSESVRSWLKEVLLSLLNVVGEAADGSAAAELIRRLSPDFLILDFDHDELDGVELCRRTSAQFPNLNILVFTSAYCATKYHNQLCRAGVRGFCLKSSEASVLLEAVSQLLNGARYCDPAIEQLVKQAPSTHMPNSELTEAEVAVLIRLDSRNKEIAEELDMRVRTVEKHIEVILAKLRVPTRIAAAAKAVEFGYVLLPVNSGSTGE